MFSTLALPIPAYRELPLNLRWLMAELASYTNRAGECWPTMHQLAERLGVSIATISRWTGQLAALHVIDRERRVGNGRYHYTLAERFLPRWPQMKNRFSHGATQEAKPPKHIKNSFARGVGEMPDERDQWRHRMRWWLKDGSWPAMCGPRPDEPDCWVPPAILAAALGKRLFRP